jgi:hypothetical protein
MSDHDHDPSHDAHAGHGHSHGHSHEPAPDVGAPLLPQDAAGASLSRALSMSFRMLTVIMFVVLVLFFFTGVTTIRPGQKGIVSVFGREVSVVGPGLHYTWPFPIGKIEVISVAKREVEMWEFWPSLSPEERDRDDLSKSTTPAEGLRPGWDGALLTGDAYLFQSASSACTKWKTRWSSWAAWRRRSPIMPTRTRTWPCERPSAGPPSAPPPIGRRRASCWEARSRASSSRR